MCRYAFKSYKSHFVCFDCRKTFKKAMVYDLAKQHGEIGRFERLTSRCGSGKFREQAEQKEGTTLGEMLSRYRAMVSTCPQCRGQMVDLGLDFKAPRKDDVQAWTVIREVFVLGHQWHTCGCNGPGFVPKDRGEFHQYLSGIRNQYRARLACLEQGKALSEDPAKEGIYWSSRIEAVEAEIKKWGGKLNGDKTQTVGKKRSSGRLATSSK